MESKSCSSSSPPNGDCKEEQVSNETYTLGLRLGLGASGKGWLMAIRAMGLKLEQIQARVDHSLPDQ